MSLQFIMGQDIRENTRVIYDDILERHANGEKTFLFVPEQANLQAERDLCEGVPGHCMMHCVITSFRRLAYLLTEEIGEQIPPVLADTGKGMVLRMLLSRNHEALQVYHGKEKKQGFVGAVRSMISELGQYAVTEKELAEMLEKVSDPMLRRKISDIGTINNLFHEYLGNNHITEEEILLKLIPLVEESVVLQDKVLYFDHYTGFTPCQLRLFEALIRKCSKCVVTVTIDPKKLNAEEDDLFSMSRKTIQSLSDIAKNLEQPILAPIVTESAGKKEDLQYLTDAIFRYPIRGYSGKEQGNISIVSAANMEEEIRFAVRTIRNLVKDEGYHYREIGILCGDVESYAEPLARALDKVEVPYYIDYKENVLTNPVVDYIRAALRVIKTDFSLNAVSQYMKNPLSDIAPIDASYVENYLIATGVRGRSNYSKDQSRVYRTNHSVPNNRITEVMNSIEHELRGLSDAFSEKKNVLSVLKALYEFFVERNLEGKAEALRIQFEGRPGSFYARKEKECKRIYGALIGLLEEMAAILSEEVLSASEFSDVFDAGLSEMQLAVIPPKQDVITMGDVKRSRMNDTRTILFLGVNEGVVPGIHHASGLFTDRERELLSEAGLVLSETRKDAEFTEEFYLYLAMSKPTDRLYLSYRRTGDDGKEMRASTLLYRIRRLFPTLSEALYREQSFSDAMSPDGGEKFLRTGLLAGRNGSRSEEVRRATAILEHFENANMIDMKRGTEYEFRPAELSPEVAREVYGDVLSGSVSRLETYAKCPFRQFVQYGLSLEERPEYGVSNADIGDLFHGVLERIMRSCKNSAADSEDPKSIQEEYRKLSEDDLPKLVEKELREEVTRLHKEILLENETYRHQYVMISEHLIYTISVIRKSVLAGGFVPYEFEKRFVKDGEQMHFTGRIDRIDLSSDEGEKYAKVVDYKSSVKKLDYARVYDGVQVQLPLYLKQVSEEMNAIPAGAMYMKIDNPILDYSEDMETARTLDMRPDGLLLSDNRALYQFDHELLGEGDLLAEGYKSNYVYAKTKNADKKTGVVSLDSRSSHVNTREEMDLICQYADQLTEKEAKQILNGDIHVEPYKDGRSLTCDYCGYRSLCNYNALTGKTRKKTKTTPYMAKPEILQKMREDLGLVPENNKEEEE